MNLAKTAIVAIIATLIENVTLTFCITYAAVTFGKPVILWFLLIPLFNGYKCSIKENNEDASKSEKKE